MVPYLTTQTTSKKKSSKRLGVIYEQKEKQCPVFCDVEWLFIAIWDLKWLIARRTASLIVEELTANVRRASR